MMKTKPLRYGTFFHVVAGAMGMKNLEFLRCFTSKPFPGLEDPQRFIKINNVSSTTRLCKASNPCERYIRAEVPKLYFFSPILWGLHYHMTALRLTFASATGFVRMCAMLLVAALMLTTAGPAFAAGGQTGNISGTVVDSATHQPLANAQVNAVSPTGNYQARTDSRGYFTIIGMNVDTYTVSVELRGYQSISQTGVTVQGDGNVSLGTLSATKELQTVAVVRSRSQGSAFQPGQTIDSYTVSGDRLLQTAGKADGTNENNLVLAVPASP